MDQAATLRKWALNQVQQTQVLLATSALVKKQLVVIGLPRDVCDAGERVYDRMHRWARRGHAWVGYQDDWNVIAVSAGDSRFGIYASEEKRWALWIDTDTDAFRRAYQLLKLVQENGGPKRILALHDPGLDPKGLLSNLRQAATDFCGIELIFLGL